MSDIPILTKNKDAQSIDLSKETVKNLEIISSSMGNFFKDYKKEKNEEIKTHKDILKKENEKLKNEKKEKKEKEKKEKKREKEEKKRNEKAERKQDEFLEELRQSGKTAGKSLYKEGFKWAVGPLRLITEPLGNFLGVDFPELVRQGLMSAGRKIRSKFKKKGKKDTDSSDEENKEESLPGEKLPLPGSDESGSFGEKPSSPVKGFFVGKPTRKQVLPIDPGAVLLFDLLSKGGKGEKGGKESKGILDSLLGPGGMGGALQSVMPMIAKLGGIAMLVGGLVWAAIDGITGYFKAGEWGVSKVSGVIGGVLGGTASGLKGAFGNMGKWALIGAGIGTLITPVIGTLIGGLIGAAVGFLLGWIGGEKIAKFFDAIGNAIGTFFTKTIPDTAKAVWNGISGFFKWIWNGIVFVANGIKDFVGGLISGVWNSFMGLFTDIGDSWTKRFKKDSGKTKQNFIQKVLLFVTDVVAGIGKFVWRAIDGILDVVKKIPIIGDVISWADANLLQPIKNFFGDIFKGIQEFISDPVTFIKNLWGKITKGISDFFDGIKKGFDEFTKDPLGFIGRQLEKLMDTIGQFFSDIGRDFEFMIKDPAAAVSALLGDKAAIAKKEAFKEKKKLEDDKKRQKEIDEKNKKYLIQQQDEMNKENLKFIKNKGVTETQINSEVQAKLKELKASSSSKKEPSTDEKEKIYQETIASMAKERGKQNVIIQNITNTGRYNPDVQMTTVPVY